MRQLSKKASEFFLNAFIIFMFFITVLFITLGIFFLDYKEKSVEEMNNNYSLNVKYYSEQMKKAILLFDKKRVDDLYLEMVDTPYIKDFNISKYRFFFDKNTLLFHTNNFKDDSWTLLDVQTDIYNGEIVKVQGTSFLEFLPSSKFNLNNKLIVRYQLLKDNVIKNFVIAIDLNLLYLNQVKEHKEEIEFPFWFKFFYNLDLKKEIVIKEEILGLEFLELKFDIDDTVLKSNLYDILINLVSLMAIVFILFILGMIPFLRHLENKYIKKPVSYLNILVQQALEYKFENIEEKKFNDIPDFDNIITNFKKLSYNLANLKNELNINKELMERNILVDNLTGLFDKKVFDLDMKEMFVSSSSGYILYFRISKLNEISTLNGSNTTDDFLVSFANCINDTLYDFNNKSIQFYRFYGSEFALIAKKVNYDEVTLISQKIIDNLCFQLPKNYSLPKDIFHIGGAPFDIYGTTESILKMAKNALINSENKQMNSFYIINEDDIKEERVLLENRVKEIINNNDFTFSFVLDSFSFDEDKLLMRELKPILFDINKKDLPIGVFIAACEKLNLNVKFDEYVILKAIDFIKNENPNYKIAINLSIKTISNSEFINFITTLVEQERIYVDKLLFSITSYSAALYNKEFKQFVEILNKLNIEILIKRYKPKDYPIEELSILGINYIRIDKELTQNSHQDLIKKHKIKNILVYSQLNDIKVLTDNIELKKDFHLLSKLDLYARSM